MKTIKIKYTYILLGIAAIAFSACSDFLTTAPKDALSPATTWKTQSDIEKFLTGCYDGWVDGVDLIYSDCMSDFGYNNFPWEGYKPVGNGSMSASNPGVDYYDFSTIRRCNTLIDNAEKIECSSEEAKKDLIAQARVIRAVNYFKLNWYYGGVPQIDSYLNAEEAKVPRKSESEIRQFIDTELEKAIPELNDAPSQRGRIAKGAAMAFRMRSALYYEDYANAKKYAQDIINLNQYSLESDYANLFNVAGQDSKEIIVAIQYLTGTYANWVIGTMYNNGLGGWSSIVPTQNLVDSYEMKDGLTKEESLAKGGEGAYDPVHPFANRDPRMAMTVVYPGCVFEGQVMNTLDEKINGKDNVNYPTNANNCSKTALSWRKYTDPSTQYSGGIWDTDACPILIRYAEVLLTYAEAANELNGPSADIYEKLNLVRNRVGMPNVDESKYNTKEKLRELIRRERGVELAGEGVRRADILRWKDENGKMLAETVLNGVLTRVVGTLDASNSNPELRAVINPEAPLSEAKIEDRVFKPYNRYLPISQSVISSNGNLKQNPGY